MSILDEIKAARAADKAASANESSALRQIKAARAADRGGPSPILGDIKRNVNATADMLLSTDALPQDVQDEIVMGNTSIPRGMAVKAAQNIPFVGEYWDEIHGGEGARQVQGAMDRKYPKTALASGVVGGIVGSLPLAAAGLGVVAKGAGLAQKVIAGGALGGLFGAVEGISSGYGAGTNPEERRAMAADRGTVGVGLGTLLGALAPVVGAGAKAVYRRIRKLDVATIADEFGVDRKTATVIRRYLANDDLTAAAKQIDRIGPDAMLADAGPATANALDTAAQTGGKALRVANERVQDRAAQSGVRLSQSMDRILGEADGVKTAARDISSRTAAVRKKAYDTAFAQPIDYAAKGGRNIEGVLSRIPPKTLQSAIDEANDAMRAVSTTNKQIMASIADDGAVVFSEMPNVQQLNQIKIALGDIAEGEVDQFGRKTAKGLRAVKLASDLREAIGGAVPAYNRAVKLGGDKIAEDKALDIGRKLLSNATSVEDVRDIMKGASVEATAAAKRGLRENISQTMDTVRRTITDPNVDAREAMALVKAMSSKTNMAKVRMVVGKEAPALFAELDKAEAALALRAAMAQNSKTAIRTAGRDAMEEATKPGAWHSLKTGSPVEASRKVMQALTGATDDAAVAMREDVAAQIAETLTGMRGEQAARALRLVQRSMAGQPLKNAEADFVVKAVGGPAALAAYQLGTRRLQQQ